MYPEHLDVVGIGNAIVDVLASADDAFLARHEMTKGAMMLIDETQAKTIYESMPPTLVSSGGSAANTVVGVASFGGKAGYIGKVHDDNLGMEFRHDIIAAGVDYRIPPATSGPSTARCLILITPDAQRTMNTYLGACVNLNPDDIDEAFVRSAKITYFEGYLYDPPLAQEAFRKAAQIAHAAGRKTALSLSDSFCVHRHHEAFSALIALHMDVVFANESECEALFGTKDMRASIAAMRTITEIGSITLGPRGSLVVTQDEVIEIPATDVERVVDTTGAGDLYAAGFLYGMTNGVSLTEAGYFGSMAAAEVISHVGGRPQVPLRTIVPQAKERVLAAR
jgi:sugar/nucleoside kinase (ribokinase family)